MSRLPLKMVVYEEQQAKRTVSLKMGVEWIEKLPLYEFSD